jgi:hypothetical protein
MMQSQEKISSLLAEALAMIEAVTTTSFDPEKVADLNRRGYAALQAAACSVPVCETMQRPKCECGCPDCGSSLIDWPASQGEQASVAEGALS